MIAVFAYIVQIVVLAPSAYTLIPISILPQRPRGMFTFCELTARLREAKSEDGSTVPRNIDLYWFIPALAKRRVGSEWGTTEEEGTRAHQYQSRHPDALYEGVRTKCMSILLEEIHKGLPYPHSGPYFCRPHPVRLGKESELAGVSR